MRHWRKGLSLPLPLLMLIIGTATPCFAQLSEYENPAGNALAGAVTARNESPWYGIANPAAVASDSTIIIAAAFVPSTFGIAGYREGSALMVLARDNAPHFAFHLGAAGAGPYRELRGSALLAFDAFPPFRAGLRAGWDVVNIEGYGTGWTAGLDLGVQAALGERIRAGAAVTNLLRSRIAGNELPQRVRLGLALDIIEGTMFSIDAVHELGRGSDIALGISSALNTSIILRGGLGSTPARFTGGALVRAYGITLEYGGAFVADFGMRHAIGITTILP